MKSIVLIGWCLWLASAGTSGAQALVPEAPNWVPKILFIGNSFTHGGFKTVRAYNASAVTDENFGLARENPRAQVIEQGPYGGVPGIFQKLADQAGLPCEIHLEAASAQTLAFHSQHALPLLLRTRWDTVVLQDYSTGPLPSRRRGSPARFFTYAALLEEIIHSRSPRARVFLYETWSRADLTFPAGRPYSGEGVGAMAKDLHDAYYLAASRNPRITGVAPVGDAWLRAIRSGVALENPYLSRDGGKINLWGIDSYHPSVHGAYLAALVLFQRVTGMDVRQFGDREHAARDLGINPGDAAKLRRIAYEEVTAQVR